MSAFPVIIPPLPFVGVIPGGLQIGMMLELICVVREGGRLYINIQPGLERVPRNDIAMQINFRDDEKVVVRNYFTSGWKTEERDGGYPITPEKTFNLKILVQETYYEILVDDERFANFTHRLPYKNNKYVYIEGFNNTDAEVRYFEIKRPTCINQQLSVVENLLNAIRDDKCADKVEINEDEVASLLLKILLRGIKSIASEDKAINTRPD